MEMMVLNASTCAAGAFDTTGKDGTISTAGIPVGVVVGTNNATTLYSSTYLRNYITSIVTTNANYALERQGVEGPWGKGDKQAYVQIALITPLTIIRMPIFNAALGTAPTVVTCTSSDHGWSNGYRMHHRGHRGCPRNGHELPVLPHPGPTRECTGSSRPPRQPFTP